METPDQKSRLNNYEVEERAMEAEALLVNSVLNSALDDIHSRHMGTLLEADVGSLTASAAHASLKAITDLRNQLKEYIADHKVRQKYNKGDK
jgi:hypothetical protein